MDIPFGGCLETIISCKSRQYGHCFYESVKRSNSLFKIVGSQLFLRITWDNYLVLVEIIANIDKYTENSSKRRCCTYHCKARIGLGGHNISDRKTDKKCLQH